VRHWPRSEPLLGADASESKLKRVRLDQFRLVHSATHAQVDERAPGRWRLHSQRVATMMASVVVTLWPVNDRASAEFLQRFYGFVASGMAATDARRLAQLDAMQRGVAPRDWAAFVLTGDRFVRVGAVGSR
jgi:CHAT domain-containing protein